MVFQVYGCPIHVGPLSGQGACGAPSPQMLERGALVPLDRLHLGAKTSALCPGTGASQSLVDEGIDLLLLLDDEAVESLNLLPHSVDLPLLKLLCLLRTGKGLF